MPPGLREPMTVIGPLDVAPTSAFSVSKRGFRHAVTRNLLKRRMKEAYRKNKYLLYEYLAMENKQVVFTLILRGNKVPDFHAIETSTIEMLNRLIGKIREKE